MGKCFQHSARLLVLLVGGVANSFAQPANDPFSNRIAIPFPNYLFNGSLQGATAETGETLPSPTKSLTVWWSIVPPADGVMALFASASEFTPSVSVFEGTNLATLVAVAPAAYPRFVLRAGREYAVQIAAEPGLDRTFTLETRYHYLSNDFFASSQRVQGTNLYFLGNLIGTTLEPGEPVPPATNTSWTTWIAPIDGRASYVPETPYQFQYFSLYTGSSVDTLQPVRVVGMGNSRYDFLASAGTAYHFQVAGGAEEYGVQLWVEPFTPAANDHFAQAQPVGGAAFSYAGVFSINDATSELGEPQHLGGMPFKSLWWRWQSPSHGTMRLYTDASLATNVVTAVYRGSQIEALSLVTKGTNNVSFPVYGGENYYIAAAVPTNSWGDVTFFSSLQGSSTVRIIPGNILQEPSWENTGLFGAVYWHWSGWLAGSVNEPGGCDGGTWPVLGNGVKIWQDFPTVPGHSYSVRFAHAVSAGSFPGDSRVLVSWDSNLLGEAVIPATQRGFWHWEELTTVASNTTTRITFESLFNNLAMDAFSVVDLTAPPAIVTQPIGLSTFTGGAAAFVVGATGSSPLSYQWYFNSSSLEGQTNKSLILSAVSTNHAGSYQVTVTNAFGAVTSVVASLVVEVVDAPRIVWQPYGDTVGEGGFFGMSLVALGSPPLTYQWFKDGVAIANATNRTLAFDVVAFTNAGTYSARVLNLAGAAWSLSARLVVTNSIGGGGTIVFNNRLPFSSPPIDAPVFDADGATKLSGSNYLAQLYGGPTIASLRPVGTPSPFRSGTAVGYFYQKTVVLPTVPPDNTAIVQVRAWDATAGASYEEARGMGGKFGKSSLLTVQVGGGFSLPANLVGLNGFQLQAGLPEFATGLIQFVEQDPPGTLVWSHQGELGYRYLIERSLGGFEWQPFVVVTNTSVTVSFTDTADPSAPMMFYRSRILD